MRQQAEGRGPGRPGRGPGSPPNRGGARDAVADAPTPPPRRPRALRVVAAAVATTLAVLAIYGFGLYARQVRYEMEGGDQLVGSFWMESAQRFRYVRMIAEGQPLPIPDTRMEAPDGYDPRSDTILQEILYGRLYRALGLEPAEVPVERFVRRIAAPICLLAIFPLLGLVGVLTDRRTAALFGCLALAASLPAAERATGQVLYREHLGVPLLAFHLFFAFSALKRRRIVDAVLAGAFLTLALLSWKVITFYFLILLGFFAFVTVVRGAPGFPFALVLSCWALPVAASALPNSLRFDLFPTSVPSVLAVTVLAVVAWDRRRPLTAPARLLLLAAVASLLLTLLPRAPSYDHAWETLAAKILHLGRKPEDPQALGFHARHFWSGNYASPGPWRMVRDFLLPLALALPGLAWLAARARREGGAGEAALCLYLTAAFVASWLAFYKLQALPALMLSAVAGVSWAAPARSGRRLALWGRRGALLGIAGLMAAGTAGFVPEPDRMLGHRPEPPPYRTSLGHVHTGEALGELAGWLRAHTGRDDIVLADFVLSPFLLAYVDRPTVLHCFFESPMVERYRDYALALFRGEEELAAFARRHRARWLVHQAHQALRDDSEMSYRYVAAAREWNPGAAASLLQFAPERLRWFRLAWQNDFFRVYEMLPAPRPDADGDAAPASDHPLWSRAFFARRCGADPMEGRRPCPAMPRALYDLVWARSQAAVARALADAGDPVGAVGILREVAAAVPDDPGTAESLARVLAEAGRPEEAAAWSARARGARAALGKAPAQSPPVLRAAPP